MGTRLALASAVNGEVDDRNLGLSAILMSPNGNLGCHRRGDMVVCMRRVDTAELIRVLKYLACVAWQFWLGTLSNKRGRAEKPRGDWGGSNFFTYEKFTSQVIYNVL